VSIFIVHGGGGGGCCCTLFLRTTGKNNDAVRCHATEHDSFLFLFFSNEKETEEGRKIVEKKKKLEKNFMVDDVGGEMR